MQEAVGVNNAATVGLGFGLKYIFAFQYGDYRKLGATCYSVGQK